MYCTGEAISRVAISHTRETASATEAPSDEIMVLSGSNGAYYSRLLIGLGCVCRYMRV